MATIKRRGNSYLFRCYEGYDQNGRQKERTMTWRIPEGMSEKKAEKEAQRQAMLLKKKYAWDISQKAKSNLPTLPTNGFDNLKKEYGVPQKNDLLVSAVGTIGTIWIVDGTFEFYFKDGNLLQIKSSDKFNSVFMKYLLTELIEDYKKGMSAGTAYAALTIAGLKKLLVYNVPIDIQNHFATFVAETDKLKLETRQSLDKLELLKKSLMQEYFG